MSTDPDTPQRGSARLDGLLNLSFPPDPGRESRSSAVLGRLEAAVPVALNVQREPGLVTLMPESATFPFSTDERPGEILLPILRDLVAALAPGVRVESTLRIQEYVGDQVREGVFVLEDEELGFTARERESRPEERPTLPEPTLSDRAESALRRFRWPITLAVGLLLVLGYVAWREGWWRPGAGIATGPSVQAGPLQGVVRVERVRWSQKALLFDLRPDEGYERFDEVAEDCSLSAGVFRVLLEREGTILPGVILLDLRELPARMADVEGDDPLVVAAPCETSRFDAVLICR